MRKFAYKEQTLNQTKNISNTEATLILCGSSGERANNRGDSTIKEEDEEKKNQKIYNQANKQRTTESTLILSGYSRELANK